MTDYRKQVVPLDVEPELAETARTLSDAAKAMEPQATFVSSLERRLAAAYPGPETTPMSSLKKVTPALMWVAATIVMVLIIEWAIRSLVPSPVPAVHNTPESTIQAPLPPIDQSTPVPSQKSYEWNGTTLSLAAPLPGSPAESGVYLAQSSEPATMQEAVVLAERFGVGGGVYQTPGELPDTTDFLVTDGKRSVRVRSGSYYNYTADVIESFNYLGAVKKPDAESVITSFLQSHGYTFSYRLMWSEFRGAYLVEPLTPEGTPLRYEDYSSPMILITLDEQGQIASFQANLLRVSAEPAGRFGIISAEEALQKILTNHGGNGVEASMHSVPEPLTQWKRVYPTDQPLTIYGRVTSFASVDSGQPAFIQIDGFPATGQTSGMEKSTPPTYVQATGRFVVENGIKRFSVESWKVSDVNEDGLIGTLQRENGQVSITTREGTHYTLPDVPAEVPMPFENAFVVGTREGEVFQWKLIDDRMTMQGGGGGGGAGAGFYKLNLTGTPVAFPSPTAAAEAAANVQPQYVVKAGDTLGSIAYIYGTDAGALMQANGMSDPGTLTIGQTLVIPGSGTRRIEGLRGLPNITINKQKDGTQQVTYAFMADATSDPGGYMQLEGDNLEALQAYNGRPVDIWGIMDATGGAAIPTVKVERYEIPFPDLKVQIYTGMQKAVEVEGQSAMLFTTQDGQTYIQLLVGGALNGGADVMLIGKEGDLVQVEAVAIPGEKVQGYPALRVFGGMPAMEGNQHVNMPITMNQPHIVEMPNIGKPSEAPTATVEDVELVHYMRDPRYQAAAPNAEPLYFQPVWRFHGHYSNGDEFEFLVQALRQEYLLPEISPITPPG